MTDDIKCNEQKTKICECSFTYNRQKHLITAGRRGGTQFVFKPHIFAKLFIIIKHEDDV